MLLTTFLLLHIDITIACCFSLLLSHLPSNFHVLITKKKYFSEYTPFFSDISDVTIVTSI